MTDDLETPGLPIPEGPEEPMTDPIEEEGGEPIPPPVEEDAP